MNNIVFFVPGKPQAKARPKVFNGRAVTPSKTTGYETEVIHAYIAKYGDFCFPANTPLEMDIVAVFKKPKGSKLTHPTYKDWDNIGKIVADALNKVTYDDDRNIVKGTVEKIFSDHEGVLVCIKEYMPNEDKNSVKLDIPK